VTSPYNDPLLTFTFSVQVDKGPFTATGFFTEMSGLTIEYPAIEYKTFNPNTAAPQVQYVPGRQALGQVTFKRGMSDNTAFLQWLQMVGQRTINNVRSDVTVTQYDRTYKPQQTWKLQNAWPVKYVLGSMTAASGDFLIEEITLVCEQILLDKS
jgi:phage tail-like protein